jgi:hypothetical protein
MKQVPHFTFFRVKLPPFFFFGFSVKPRSGEAIDVDFTRPGKHTKNHGKSPCLMDKSTISMAIFMLNYQRIFLLFSVEESRFAVLSLILRTAIFFLMLGGLHFFMRLLSFIPKISKNMMFKVRSDCHLLYTVYTHRSRYIILSLTFILEGIDPNWC